jgi:hypothetical protein
MTKANNTCKHKVRINKKTVALYSDKCIQIFDSPEKLEDLISELQDAALKTFNDMENK